MADRGDSEFGNGGGTGNAQEEFETADIEEKFATLNGVALDPKVAPLAKRYEVISEFEEALKSGEFDALGLTREELRREWKRWQKYYAKREAEREADAKAAKLRAQRQKIEAVLGGEGPDARPKVPVDENRWPWVLNKAEELLLQQGDRVGFYCSSSREFLLRIVHAHELSANLNPKEPPPDDGFIPQHGVWRPHGALVFTRVTLPMIQDVFETHLQFRRGINQVPSECPLGLAKRYLSRVGGWKFKALRGVISAPLVRMDGSLLLRRGFDEQTGLFLHSDNDWSAPAATDEEALARAKTMLLEPLAGFPITEQEKSIVVAAQLTGLERRLLPSAPAFAIDASVPSAGKSLLSDYIAMTVTGHRPSTIHYEPKDEEMVKRLDAALLEGDAVIKLDNITTIVKHPRLAQMITEEILKVRLFGTLQNVNVLSNVLILMTGNHLHFGWDLPTRILLVKLIIEMEHPEQRTFAIPRLRQWALRNRRRQVNALLAVAYAYHAANRPKINLAATRFDGDDWTEMVRKPLIYAGFVDPVPSESNVEVSNPDKDDMAAVFSAWYAAQPTAEALTCKEVIDLAEQGNTAGSGQLKNALAQVAGDGRGNIDTRRLGNWCRFQANEKIVAGLMMVRGDDDVHVGVARWRVGPSELMNKVREQRRQQESKKR